MEKNKPLPTTSTPPPDSSLVAEFYDEFSERLLRDYVRGNSRVEAAIDRVCRVIPDTKSHILDIGCGIGYSSSEYLRRKPHTTVVGVDISPTNIKLAQSLFEKQNLHFLVSDLEVNPFEERFDVIALLDVYEHIPRIHWPRFNGILADLLTDDGQIVLTTPSSMHQDYLKEHDPEGLQIIDETVSSTDIVKLAEALDAQVMLHEIVSIWGSNEYQHLVLSRDPTRNLTAGKTWMQRVSGKAKGIVRRYKRFQRRKHIRNSLELDL